MKRTRIKFLAAVSVLALSALACNLLNVSAPTPFVFPTANLTLTAVFAPTGQPPESTGLPAQATSLSPTSQPGLPGTVTSQAPAAPSLTPTQKPSATATTAPPTANPPAPTNTPVPTVSYAGPAVRKGRSMAAAYLAQKPTIDGDFSDWNLDRYTIDSVVLGAKNIQGAGDLSAKVMWAWDEKNLYLAAKVIDDVYVQNATGDQIFKGDSLEILIDTDVPSDYFLKALDDDDFQLGISAGRTQPGNSPEAYLWFPKSVEGTLDRVKIGAYPLDDGYRVEAAIPWSTFGVQPKAGQHFGFGFSVSDDDQVGSKLQQSMVSSAADRTLDDPTTWGDLTLSAFGPKQRTGAPIQSPYTTKPPTLDGSLADWSASGMDIKSVVFGAEKWSGAADLSGNLRTAWDEKYLYLGVRVYDDRYVQNASEADLFLGDSLEILLDANISPDFYQRSLSGDDYQVGISPGSPTPGKDPEAYLWYPQGRAGPLTKVKIAAAPEADGYSVEAAIPWSYYGITPGRGNHFGFAFSISDNDNPDKDVQQSMLSSAEDTERAAFRENRSSPGSC
ncbi:MAG TPA: sugar-binding protein, partial [Anaerolineales bacterium]